MRQRIMLLFISVFLLILTGCQYRAGNVVSPHEYPQKQRVHNFDYSRYEDEVISLRIHEITSLPGGEIFLGGSYCNQANTIHTALLVSQNGGQTWKDAGIKVYGCGVMNFQTFGLSHVWAISTYLQEGCHGPVSLLYSTDAGQSWSARSLDFIGQDQGLDWVQQFQFFDQFHGLLIITGSTGPSRIYITSDGGKTWEKIMTSRNYSADDFEIESSFPDYSRQNINNAALWMKSTDDYYKISGWIRIRKTDSYNDPYIVIESKELDSREWKPISQIPRYYKIEKDILIPVDSGK
ncbi:MAG: hypothetical protein KAS23_15135 [Anaerohalosphaera sp.]|nr:hypothetical protein [Anaerohalosphaera sp.]